MNPLYLTVRARDAEYLGGASGDTSGDTSDVAGATREEIEQAEASLGVKLPPTYRAFVEAVGSASWPVEILGVEVLERGGGFGEPAWFVAFASDYSGNSWGFDVRAADGGEYPILFWDHEDPPPEEELAEPGPPTSFDGWLEELVGARLAEEHEAAESDRWARIGDALDRHRGGVFPYAPALEDVREVEARLGRSLPRDYVEFTTRFGSTEWPIVMVDAQEVEALTQTMTSEHPELDGAIAFGRATDGSYLAFRGDAVVGPRGEVAPSFGALLEVSLFARSGT